jgi:hypothetical protein
MKGQIPVCPFCWNFGKRKQTNDEEALYDSHPETLSPHGGEQHSCLIQKEDIPNRVEENAGRMISCSR